MIQVQVQVQVPALTPSRVVCGDAVVLRGRMFWFLGDDDAGQPIVSFFFYQIRLFFLFWPFTLIRLHAILLVYLTG